MLGVTSLIVRQISGQIVSGFMGLLYRTKLKKILDIGPDALKHGNNGCLSACAADLDGNPRMGTLFTTHRIIANRYYHLK